LPGARFFSFYGSNVYQTCIGSESRSSWIIWQDCCILATVEQQGRLTLHLHMLLWILNSLSPQEIRDRLWPKFWFPKKNSGVLEECACRWIHDRKPWMKSKNKLMKIWKAKEYRDPPNFNLMPLQSLQSVTATNVNLVENTANWWQNFKNTVDDLILRSNCPQVLQFNPSWWEKQKQKSEEVVINKHGNCKARFPRQTFEKTEVDPRTGAA